jgi:hypothetical protein
MIEAGIVSQTSKDGVSVRLRRAVLVFVCAVFLGPLVPAAIILLGWSVVAVLSVPVANWDIHAVFGVVLFVTWGSYFLGGVIAGASGLIIAVLVFVYGTVTPTFAVSGVVLGTAIVGVLFGWWSRSPDTLESFLALGGIGILSAGTILALADWLKLLPRRGRFGFPTVGRRRHNLPPDVA